MLAVVRSLPYTNRGYETPYTGMVPIHSGGLRDGVVGCCVVGARAGGRAVVGKLQWVES